jgi:hypothetical protein
MHLAKPEAWFYPVAPGDWETIFAEGSMALLDRHPETRTVHLWNEMTKRKPGFDRNGRFPETSMFEELKRRYLGDR